MPAPSPGKPGREAKELPTARDGIVAPPRIGAIGIVAPRLFTTCVPKEPAMLQREQI